MTELGTTFTRTIPTPPASRTARLLLTRAFVPRSHSTILPVTFAGSKTGCPPLSAAVKHRASAIGFAPGNPAATESMKGADGTALASDAPVNVTPLPSVTDPRPSRLCVPAATVVIHGLGCATVPTFGPLLPAEADTNTPDSAALKNASSAGSAKLDVVPEIE